MDNKKVVILLLILLLVMASIFVASKLIKDHFLEFDFVTSIDVDEQLIEESAFAWMSLISEEYEPLLDIEYLEGQYGIGKILSEQIDTEKYTYVIVFGHELKAISYNLSDARTKYLGFIPKQIIARVVLSQKKTTSIYVYKVKKCNIVNDYYGNGFDMVLYETDQSGDG